MKRAKVTSILGFIIFNTCAGFAQTDPDFLSLTGAGDGVSGQSWSGDSHYVHKKSKKQLRKPASDEEPKATPTPSPDAGPVVTRLSPAETTSKVEAAPTPALPSTPQAQTQDFTAKFRDAVMGGDEDLIQNYKSFLDDQDPRKNFFELSIGSGYLYNTSTSSYSYRNYNDSGPTVDLNADIWLSPFLGVTAEYKTTLLNEVSDSLTQNTYVSSTQSWIDLGLKFRRFFGMTVNAPSLTLGLRYSQYQMAIPQSSQMRSKLSNQGPELDLDMALPLGKYSLWTLGLMLQPFDSLSEMSGSPVRAGQSNQTVGFGASIGGEYRFSRRTTAFLKFTSMVYKSDFSGSATAADPTNSITPSSVPVSNFFYFLDLGIRLGY